MPNRGYQKARAKEQELRRAFEEEGWFAIRSPGSSGGYDLVAAKDGRVLVLELKYVPAGDKADFEYQELFGGEDRPNTDDGIMGVAEEFDADDNAYAFAVTRWKQDTTFYACPPPLLDRRGKDNDGMHCMDPEKKDEYIELPPPVDTVDDTEEAQPDADADAAA